MTIICCLIANLLTTSSGFGMSLHITLFKAIIVFCRTDGVMWNIPHIQSKCEDILQNVVSPAKHCYGSK